MEILYRFQETDNAHTVFARCNIVKNKIVTLFDSFRVAKFSCGNFTGKLMMKTEWIIQ